MTDVLETPTNGHARGRAVPALVQHTFKDTGITVGIRKLSPLLRDDIDMALRNEFPEPEPPIVETELGKEANPADEDYLKRRAEWMVAHMERRSERMLRIAIKRGVEVEVDHEAVAQLRTDMAEQGVDLDPDDAFVYVTRICIGSSDDLQELYDALTKRSMPTREAVEAHKATFPGDVQGA